MDALSEENIFMKAISNNFLVFSVLYLKVQAACLPWQGVASQSRPMKMHNTEYNPKSLRLKSTC
jgi:hypothetical protein